MSTVDSACWIWLGATDQAGYGRVYPKPGKPRGYHRVVWKELNGHIDQNMDLHHLCENKRCYNPKHLLPVGRVAHMYIHSGGYTWRGKNKCRRGHPLTVGNIRVRFSKGYPMRVCHVCENIKRAAWRKENRDHCRKQLRDWRARNVH